MMSTHLNRIIAGPPAGRTCTAASRHSRRTEYGWPLTRSDQDGAPPRSRRRRIDRRSSDEGARLHAPVRIRPLPPAHRPPAQPLSQRKAPQKSSPPAQERQYARIADRPPLRLRFRELLPPAVSRTLRHVPPPVPRKRYPARADSTESVNPAADGVI